MSKITMRCTVAICIAALFVLMGPASMAQSGRVVGGGTTSFGTNPGGKYIYGGGAKFGTNPGGKYVYSGGNAKFHTNPGGKNRWYGSRRFPQPLAHMGGPIPLDVDGAISALGQKRTLFTASLMSALLLKADIQTAEQDVR